jgi:hypothetical protein
MNSQYNYPKSSCDTCMCDTKNSLNLVGKPSNMSVPDCNTPSLFEYNTTTEFRSGIGPSKKQGYRLLNPNAITSKYARDYYPIKCDKAKYRGCQTTQYANIDPRLISVTRAQILTLDRPPIQTKLTPEEILTDKSLNRYGQNYTGYNDINAGQILYYVDKQFEDPFYSPNFSTSAHVQGVLYQDPMGSMKPHYNRTPIKCRNPVGEKSSYEGQLSWIQDSTNHREDLLARQMAKMNQERFEPRWYNGK